MYVARIHINGYGIFSNCDLPGGVSGEGFSQKLSVVVGPNESGKTTLLSFIRAVLFGFPDGRSTENAYLPTAGGRHGGLITLVGGQGQKYVVERSPGPRGGVVRVMMPDGAVGGISELETLLGHASRELFRNVFAFGLTELQAFQTLASDEVSARIYSAGLGAGRLSIGEIEGKLERMRGELFTTDKATSKQITALLSDCTQIRQQLQEIGDQAARYGDLGRELHSLEDRLGDLRKARAERRISLDHCADLLRAWEFWTEVQAAKEKLSKLPAIERFPKDGLTRLEVILARVRGEKENVRRAQADLDGLQRELNGINVDRALSEQGAEVVSLERGLAKYVSARDDLPKREVELKGLIEELNRSLSDLGPGWDEQRVLAADTSIAARDAVREHGASLAERQQKLHDATLTARQASDRLEDAIRELRYQEDNLKGMPEPREHEKAPLESRLRFAKSLLAALADYRTRLQERDGLTERRDDKNAHVARMERRLSSDTETLQLPLFVTILLLLVPVFGWLVLYYLRRVSLRLQEQRAHLVSDLRDTENELKEIEDKLAAIDGEIKKEQGQLRSLATNAGLEAIPSAGEAAELINGLDDELARLESWLVASGKVRQAREASVQAERALENAQRIKGHAEEDLGHAEKGWAAWLQGVGITVDCLPATALELLSRVESAAERVGNIGRARERLTSIGESLKEYEDAANAVLEAIGDRPQERPEFPAAVHRLIDRFRAAEADNERLQQLQRAVAEKTLERDGFQEALKSAEQDLDRLLTDGGAGGEQEFREREKAFNEIAQLNTTIQQSTRALEQIAGQREALESFMSELKAADPGQLRQRRRLAEEELQAMEVEIDAVKDKASRISQQIDDLERAEEASDLRMRLGVLQERLRVKAQQWVVLTIGQTLLREARAKYERERKPAVVQQGQHFFSMITGDRYPRLISPPGETQILVEDRSGRRKALTELSRGTAEQLYLALRFGLVKEFSRHSESLPVVMDDILVNFDPQRAGEAAGAIAELAEDNQVIVFTCHPETADLLKARSPGSLVIGLQDRQG